MRNRTTETAAAYLSGVDLAGLPPEQYRLLEAHVAELLDLAEAFGYRKAIQALRKEAADLAAWGGLDHPFRRAADYLEAIAEEGRHLARTRLSGTPVRPAETTYTLSGGGANLENRP